MQSVSVIGLGKVGSVLAALHLNLGRFVYGFESNPVVARIFETGDTSISHESVVRDALMTHGSQLRINDYRAAAENCKIFEFIVPTPSLPDGKFDYSHLEKAILEVLGQLKMYGDPKVPAYFVIKSTVSPGTCRKLQEKVSQLSPDYDVRVVYNPEFIALGEVAKGMQYPDLCIVGTPDLLDSKTIFDHGGQIRRNELPHFPLDYEAAEIAKLAVNTFVTTKISFANLIGQLVNSASGTSPSVVLSAIGSDTRIGQRYLMPGLGYGGPCFPRDNAALASSLLEYNLPTSLPDAVDEMNSSVPELVVSEVMVKTRPGDNVLVLGLAYKPGTDVIIESQAVMVCRHLADEKVRVDAFDPMVKNVPLANFNVLLELPDFSSYDKIICAVAWPEFEQFREGWDVDFIC